MECDGIAGLDDDIDSPISPAAPTRHRQYNDKIKQSSPKG